MKNILFIIAICLVSCQKDIDYGLEGDLPTAPEFMIEQVPENPNRFVVTDLSAGNFTRLWEFDGGSPATSKLVSDTVTYNKKGNYNIKLHISAENGNGTAFNSKAVVVEQDVAGCPLPFLNEDCSAKCWSLSQEEASVMVGPSPFSGEWYTSPNITPNQADDQWCFNEDGTLEYNNGGATFSACQGFIDVEDYPIPSDISFTFDEGSGFEGFDQIEIDGIFFGIEDTGPSYNIVELSSTKMVMLTPIKPCDGSESPGWFTLTFVSN